MKGIQPYLALKLLRMYSRTGSVNALASVLIMKVLTKTLIRQVISDIVRVIELSFTRSSHGTYFYLIRSCKTAIGSDSNSSITTPLCLFNPSIYSSLRLNTKSMNRKKYIRTKWYPFLPYTSIPSDAKTAINFEATSTPTK